MGADQDGQLIDVLLSKAHLNLWEAYGKQHTDLKCHFMYH